MHRCEVDVQIWVHRGMETSLLCLIERVVCGTLESWLCRVVVWGVGEGDVWWRVGGDCGENDWS